jgi:hypothetical protein
MRKRRSARSLTAQVPNPNGCRLCGIDQHGHAIQAGADGSHIWQQPTQEQIKDRMLARRAKKGCP